MKDKVKNKDEKVEETEKSDNNKISVQRYFKKNNIKDIFLNAFCVFKGCKKSTKFAENELKKDYNKFLYKKL